MGIFGAMTTAVSGLSAQAYALENISGNIANSQTTGFKRVETSFVDMIPDGGSRRELSGSVNGYSRQTNTVQGQIQASSNPTHMAINGDGYFTVQGSTQTIDNKPVFTGLNYYTRRGDFDLDRNGYMVNGANMYLRGLPLDKTTGNPSGSSPETIKVTNDVIGAQATTQITYRASLPSRPQTANADTSVAGSELMAPALIGSATIATANVSNFVNTSVSGGSITVYNAQGNEVSVQMRWAKTANAAAGPPAVQDTWSLYYQSVGTTGSEQWTRIGGNFTFDAAGQITAPTANPTITGLSVNGTSVGNTTLDIGVNGLTQFSRNGGTVEVTSIDQDGYGAGRLANVAITESGRLRANYTNGRTVDLYQIPIATFNGDNALKRMDGGVFGETGESGAPIYSTTAGRVVSKSLEGSNVDVSEEFTKLIVTQQAYAANTRIVTTSNQMLQETINMIR